MEKTKILAVALMVVALSLITTAKTSAAWKGWTEYFTQDEGKAIKKMVDSYIRDSIESNDKRWRDIISGSIIKDGEIDSNKVDSTIAKRKVYTGTINCQSDPASVADKTTTDNNGDTTYWKKVTAPEISLSNASQVLEYTKYSAGSELTQLDSNIWSISGAVVSEGSAWINYGNDEDPVEEFGCQVTDYKVVISY